MGKGKGVLWFLYVCVLGLGFSRTTASLTRMMGLSVSAYFLLTAALIIAVLLFFYLPGKLLAGKLGSGTKKSPGRRRPKVREREPYEKAGRIGPGGWLLGILLLGALVCVRLFLAPKGGNAAGQPGFEQVAAAFGQDSAGFFLMDLYRRSLSVLIRLFGENSAVFWGGLIFQVLGSLFLYFGVSMLAGGICACTALLSVICLSAFHNSTYMAEPQSLLFLFFSVTIWVCALCIRMVQRRADGQKGSGLPGLAAGFVCGAACGVYPVLGSLLFLFPAGVLRYREKRETVRLHALFWGAAICSFFLIICLNCAGSGQSLTTVWARWLDGGISREYDAVLHSPSLTDLWTTVPMYLLAFLAVFGVLEQEQADDGLIWIPSFLCIMAAEYAGGAPLQEQGIRFALLGVMAGYGIRQTIWVSGDQSAKDSAEKEESREIRSSAPTEPEVVRESKQDQEEGGEENVAVQKERGSRGISETQEQTDKPQEPVRVLQRPEPGTWLDNPLPVPKRHVKKEMGYGFEPGPDQMFFDIPVSDQDDFDIE